MSDIPNWDQCFVLLSASSEVFFEQVDEESQGSNRLSHVYLPNDH